jgi:hypothetical protein
LGEQTTFFHYAMLGGALDLALNFIPDIVKAQTNSENFQKITRVAGVALIFLGNLKQALP